MMKKKAVPQRELGMQMETRPAGLQWSSHIGQQDPPGSCPPTPSVYTQTLQAHSCVPGTTTAEGGGGKQVAPCKEITWRLNLLHGGGAVSTRRFRNKSGKSFVTRCAVCQGFSRGKKMQTFLLTSSESTRELPRMLQTATECFSVYLIYPHKPFQKRYLDKKKKSLTSTDRRHSSRWKSINIPDTVLNFF